MVILIVQKAPLILTFNEVQQSRLSEELAL